MAEALREPFGAWEALQRAVALSSALTQPSRLTRRVAASDYAESTIILLTPSGRVPRGLPPRRRRGGAALTARQAQQIADLAFHTSHGAPEGLRRRVLFAERYAPAGRAGHPRLKRRPTLAQFCKLEHVIVSPDGGGFVGVTYRWSPAQGLRARWCCPYRISCSCCPCLASTDLVGTPPSGWCAAPARTAWSSRQSLCQLRDGKLWHQRSHRDPAPYGRGNSSWSRCERKTEINTPLLNGSKIKTKCRCSLPPFYRCEACPESAAHRLRPPEVH